MAGAFDFRTRPQAVDFVKRLRASIAATLLGLLGAVAVTFLVRRVSGALVQPLSGVGIATVTAAIVSIVATYRTVLPRTEYSVLGTQYSQAPTRHARVLIALSLVLPSLAALTALASLSIAGTPIVGLLIAWLLFIAAEACQWPVFFQPELRGGGLRASITAPHESAADPDEAEIPRGLVQQITRTIDGDGESIHALLSASVAAGDRLGVIHVAFCPPLAALPDLSAHAIEADDAEVRITQAETFGARLEIRLPKEQPSSRSLVVELLGSATAPPGS